MTLALMISMALIHNILIDCWYHALVDISIKEHSNNLATIFQDLCSTSLEQLEGLVREGVDCGLEQDDGFCNQYLDPCSDWTCPKKCQSRQTQCEWWTDRKCTAYWRPGASHPRAWVWPIPWPWWLLWWCSAPNTWLSMQSKLMEHLIKPAWSHSCQ